MSNKKSRQQTKMARQRISYIFALILLFLMFLFFLAFSIRNIIICNNIKTNNLKEYSGTCIISRSQRLRNTIYFISLENGDVVRIAPELLEDTSELKQLTSLCITYSTLEFGFPPAYSGIKITNLEGDMVFLKCERSIEEAKMGTYTGLCLTVLVLALLVPFSFSLFAGMSHHLNKHSK